MFLVPGLVRRADTCGVYLSLHKRVVQLHKLLLLLPLPLPPPLLLLTSRGILPGGKGVRPLIGHEHHLVRTGYWLGNQIHDSRFLNEAWACARPALETLPLRLPSYPLHM